MTPNYSILLNICAVKVAFVAVVLLYMELSRMCTTWLDALCLACCTFRCSVRIHLTPIHFI